MTYFQGNYTKLGEVAVLYGKTMPNQHKMHPNYQPLWFGDRQIKTFAVLLTNISRYSTKTVI
jgi:hypothetical protein